MIVSAWALQSIRIKKFIFRKTILDLPLIIYLSIYLISALFSIDPRTSWLGYYSRFNGGFISQICYVILYWAFVSNINAKQALHSMYYMLLSTALASILAIGEKFGIFGTCALMRFGYKESCWVQDVQTRVFSTLGQPNWLAAILTALIPISWSFALKAFSVKRLVYSLLSILFFVTLLFTKSRSGLLAFGIEAIIFWGLVFYKEKLKYLKLFTIQLLVFGLLSFTILFKPTTNSQQLKTAVAPVLETGGTESGTIRKFVWLGAVNVFLHYPIFGSGPETFAFSYPMFKPVEANLTSEWDFIYNKAHNEFLNYLANTGLLGFVAYIILIIFSVKQIITNKYKFQINKFATIVVNTDVQSKQSVKLGIGEDLYLLDIGIISAYVSILVTNFFGFTVVPVSLLFYLFPAVAIAFNSEDTVISYNSKKIDTHQKLFIILVLLTTLYTLYVIRSYWLADVYFNKSDFRNALSLTPNEPNYLSKLALLDGTDETAINALELNKHNQNSRKVLISNLIKNSGDKPNNLLFAESIIVDGLQFSVNDPKLYYQLGILQLKMGKDKEAISNLEKAVSLKPNYKEGRYILGATHKALKEDFKAKEQFEYIIKNIDPNDELTKKYLEEVN